MDRFVRSGLVLIEIVVLTTLGGHSVQGQTRADSAAQEPGTERFEELMNLWTGTPAGSPEEAVAADSLFAFVRRTLGDSALSSYSDYLRASVGSDGETKALDDARQAVQNRGLQWSRGEQLLEAYFLVDEFNALASVGVRRTEEPPSIAAIEPMQLSLRLLSPPDGLEAGDAFTVQGELTNHSDRIVWFLDRSALLHVPPSIWGSTTARGAIGARVPPGAKGKLIPRSVHPGGSRRFLWDVDPFAARILARGNARGSGAAEVLRRGYWAFWDFASFHPTTYRITALVHVWPERPEIPDDGQIPLAASVIEVADYDFQMRTPTIVLLFGAIVGGILGFILTLASRLRDGRNVRQDGGLTFIIAGATSAVVLAAVMTVLLTRLSDADFIVSVEVEDVWGALAIGFVVQWIGLRYLTKILGDPERASTPARIGPDRQLQEGGVEA